MTVNPRKRQGWISLLYLDRQRRKKTQTSYLSSLPVYRPPYLAMSDCRVMELMRDENPMEGFTIDTLTAPVPSSCTGMSVVHVLPPSDECTNMAAVGRGGEGG